MLLSHSPDTQGRRAISTTDAFDRVRARRRCSGAPQILQVVQASTRLPRRCRLAPGSPEGAGWLQAPPEGAGWPYSPQMVQADVSKCPGAPSVFGAVFRRQVSRPGGAGVVPKWCRLAPSSPEGVGWLQAPQKVQAGSRLPRRCRQVLLSPDGAGRLQVSPG